MLLLYFFLLFFSPHLCLATEFLPAPLLDIEYVLAARHFAGESYLHAEAPRRGHAIEAHFEDQTWSAYPFRRIAARPREAHCGIVYRQDRKIIIAYHGSDYISDWIADLKIKRRNADVLGLRGLVHTGFSTLISETHENLVDSIRIAKTDAVEELGGLAVDFDYVVTGHSLGGALSILGAAMLVSTNPAGVFETGRVLPNQVKVIAFSPPNVANGDCVEDIHKMLSPHNILCYTNKFDIVTHVPPTLFGLYSSVGTRIEYNLDDHIRENILEKISDIPNMRPGDIIAPAALASYFKGTIVAPATIVLMHEAASPVLVSKMHLENASIFRRLENVEDFSKHAPRHSISNIYQWLSHTFSL